MSRVFEDIKLTWKGKEYVIPGQHVMKAIARIEDHVTLKELMEGMAKGAPKFSKISSAYASVLRFTGCAVEDEEVYEGMLCGSQEESEAGISVIAQALTGLLNMMMPPKAMRSSVVEVKGSGESKRRQSSPKVEASSSPKRSKQPTAGD